MFADSWKRSEDAVVSSNNTNRWQSSKYNVSEAAPSGIIMALKSSECRLVYVYIKYSICNILTFLRDTHCLQTTLSLFLSITLRESELSIKGLCFMDSYYFKLTKVVISICIKSLVLHVRYVIHICVSECCLHPPVAAAYNPQKQQPVPD